MEIDLVLKGEMFGKALAVGSEDADGVGFVEEKEGLVFGFEGNDFRESGEVTIHGEDGFGDDENTALCGL